MAVLDRTCGFSADERHAIIALIREPANRTHAVDQAWALVLAQLGPRDFQWPEFDRWHALFAKGGVFPALWDGIKNGPHGNDLGAPTRQAYRTQKLYLLVDWLYGLIVTRAEMRTALMRYEARGLSAEISRQSSQIACPVCDPFNREHVPHHSGNIPPFHPGCRCLIVAAHPTTRLA